MKLSNDWEAARTMIVIKSPRTREEFKAYYSMRYRVLREPLGLPKGTEKDDYEPLSEHFMAVDDENGEILGVVKMYERETGVAQFSHLAVSPDHQGRGVGRLLVNYLEGRARELGYKSMGTTTRASATGFYERCGYRVTGIASPLFGRLQILWMDKDLEITEDTNK
ncbi:MAG TPA: GNAT family N-acetyltransferase [Anaerolineaceae bacterium]|jgi:ribosomal protein S18 acetylase RimI-like enzyme|nr:GNAT family N-acetyltransferase [Anaerolineaceae bacterium]